ncbi:hypothetical protein [Nitrospina gracilis]|uniref:hypothetical protein n=1 Tax=Nitrospina gracilis TaxID=35801 RepID=UPI001F3CF676|nr:hypothetical protein [Nitrospina gracilis]MCF8721613.1 hypothetical protein [Nitrospina gracilis Nb-211]
MAKFFGIYGFNFTKPIETRWFSLSPIYKNKLEIDKLAIDTNNLHLTGIGKANVPATPDHFFHLEGSLTFIQQQLIILDLRNQTKKDYPNSIPIFHKRNHGNSLILNDTFNPDSTRKLLHTLFLKLTDESFCQNTGFREALYRNVTIYKLPKPIIDITYYLSFSGLELVARKNENDYSRPTAQVINRFLKNFGFLTTLREMEIFTGLRNALFHNGKYEWAKRATKTEPAELYKLTDYDIKCETLLCDAILKLINFDDQTINWNRWKDRMGFTG